jgi:CHAT domain-containing protein
LPKTATELANIAQLVREHGQIAETRDGLDATKENLIETDLTRFRYLHFATHGILPTDLDIPDPALVFSYDGVSMDDMLLPSSQVLKLRIRADSVVLSACNTGSGDVSRAEGVMSLGRAFLLAGASSVTVSLWEVDDDSTAAFMTKYYSSLLSGESKPQALAEARLGLIKAGYKDPYYWAPFILVGN